MADPRKGWQSYLFLAKETTWGTLDNTVYFYMPVTDYTVDVTQSPQFAAVKLGQRQRRHTFNERLGLAGNLSAPLLAGYPDVDGVPQTSESWAEKLINWAMAATGSALQSHTAEWDDGENERRDLGLRVGNMTLSGSQSAGVNISLDLIGKNRVDNFGSLQSIPADPPPLNQFTMSGATLTLDPDGTPLVLCLSAFSLTVNNNLNPDFCDEATATLLLAGEREVAFNFTAFADRDSRDWGADVNAILSDITTQGLDMRLNFVGDHGGTGADDNTTMQIDMPIWVPQTAPKAGGKNDTITVTPGGVAVAGSSADVAFTFGTS